MAERLHSDVVIMDVSMPQIRGDAADPDGDGANNRLEYTNGTDPLAADDTTR